MVRWIRKALVLALAALGIQYGRMLARVLFAELRPARERLAPGTMPDGPLLIRGTSQSTSRVATTVR